MNVVWRRMPLIDTHVVNWSWNSASAISLMDNNIRTYSSLNAMTVMAWINAAVPLFPYIGGRTGTFFGAPFAVKNAGTGRLVDVQMELSSTTSAQLIPIDPADRPSLLPGDAFSVSASSQKSSAPPSITGIHRYGIGVYAFPVYDDGFSPIVVNFVPDTWNQPGFPLYARGYCFGWYNSLADIPTDEECFDSLLMERLSIDAYADLGLSRFGINTAYNVGGSIDVEAWSDPTGRTVVFAFDPAWTLVDRITMTNFSVSIVSSAHARLQELSGDRRIVGYRWIGHGYWMGTSADPAFVELGSTFGSEMLTMNQDKVSMSLVDMPYDFSGLFRVSALSNYNKTVDLGHIAMMHPNDVSDHFMIAIARAGDKHIHGVKFYAREI